MNVEQKKDEAGEAERQGIITSAEIPGSAKIPVKSRRIEPERAKRKRSDSNKCEATLRTSDFLSVLIFPLCADVINSILPLFVTL